MASPRSALASVIGWAIVALVLIWAFGMIVGWIAFSAITEFAPVGDVAVWYAGRTILVGLLLVGLATYSFWISLAGRSLFSRELLPDQAEVAK